MNSKRILAIASLIEKNDFVVDIGCDHAYLDIYLVKNKLCKKVIASDISEGAINQARINIEKYNLTNKIDLILSDGLDNIDYKKLNTIVISGMGTQTILNILKSNKIKNIKKIIIQSNNNLSMLRKKMVSRGYSIEKEIAVLENNKYYDIILFVPGNMKINNTQILLGVYNKDNKFYYEYLYFKNISLLKKLPKTKIVKRYKLLIINYMLKKYLKSS